jgi:guanidinopropionase
MSSLTSFRPNEDTNRTDGNLTSLSYGVFRINNFDLRGCSMSTQGYNQPVPGWVTPRFAGISTFYRLPHTPLDEAKNVDIGIVGIPWDGGTTNRPGPRHGPRQMRDQSSMVRRMHQTTHVLPYDLANVADLGDCPVNPADVVDALNRVETYFRNS